MTSAVEAIAQATAREFGVVLPENWQAAAFPNGEPKSAQEVIDGIERVIAPLLKPQTILVPAGLTRSQVRRALAREALA